MSKGNNKSSAEDTAAGKAAIELTKNIESAKTAIGSWITSVRDTFDIPKSDAERAIGKLKGFLEAVAKVKDADELETIGATASEYMTAVQAVQDGVRIEKRDGDRWVLVEAGFEDYASAAEYAAAEASLHGKYIRLFQVKKTMQVSKPKRRSF